MFRRYADDSATIADLTRWLTDQGIPTRTGKTRWDRSVVWGMLRNPAYAGRAVFGKTMIINESPGLNRRARLEGRDTPRATKTVDRPREDWVTIPVPAIIDQDTFDRVAQRLEDNKRFASRNSKKPSLLQGLAACSGCGYGYYRTSARTTNKTIYYYRCLGSDDYRYEGGRVCHNKPVRADYLDQVVWDHITGLLADPTLIRAEIDKRLHAARTADPANQQRQSLQLALAKATTAITRMIEAFQEQLVTIDELRARMPDLRARETNLRNQIDALEAQHADRERYLTLATTVETFLDQLHHRAGTADVEQRQRVLRLVVKDVLIGPDNITIRHRIPARQPNGNHTQEPSATDTEGDHRAGYPLCWGRSRRPLRRALLTRRPLPVLDDPGRQPLTDQPPDPLVRDPVLNKPPQPRMINLAEKVLNVRVKHPAHPLGLDPHRERVQRIMLAAPRPKPIREAPEVHLVDGVEHLDDRPLNDLVLQRSDPQRPLPTVRLRDVRTPRWRRPVAPRLHPLVQILQVDLQVLPVTGPGHPIHPWRRVRADRPVRRPEPTQRDVVQQRGEPRILVPSCYLTHTAQRTGRPLPGTVSGVRFAVRVPLGSSPFLPRLRSRSLVRRVRRYYATIRLPTLVHLRRTTLCSLSDPPADQADG
jgi:site-specific DNA recombinase